MNNLSTKTRRSLRVLVIAAIVACALPSVAAEKKRRQTPDPQANQSEPLEIGFYEAIEQRKIDVRVVPSNYSSLTMRVRNITRVPLKVALPTTFAAVPVARMQARAALQMRGIQTNLGSNFVQNAGSSQGLGGSLGGPWWGDSLAQVRTTEDQPLQQQDGVEQGQDQDDRQYCLMLAPGQFVQAQIPCFCLEFGNPDPNRRIPYAICPLEDLNQKPGVAELLKTFTKQGINQFVAQLAAWHIANDVPWNVLAKVRFPRTKTSRGHRVTPMELAAAQKLALQMRASEKQDSLAAGSR